MSKKILGQCKHGREKDTCWYCNGEYAEMRAAQSAPKGEHVPNGVQSSIDMDRGGRFESGPFSLPILDQGFVRLVTFVGGDIDAVQSARVSFGQGSKGEEKDKRLINYLMKHKHETPFEHSQFKFHVRCPLFVARQWFRHRICSYSEVSGRYTAFDEGGFHLPAELRYQDQDNKQGSSGKLPDVEYSPLIQAMDRHYEASWTLYQKLMKHGVAREQAREVLPLSLYTEFYWAINARSLFNFMMLRMDEHAQKEIRLYAVAIFEMFEKKMPWTAEAFLKYYFADKNTGLPEVDKRLKEKI